MELPQIPAYESVGMTDDLPPSPAPERGPLVRGLLAILRAVITVFIILDELLRPLYRPLLRRLAELRVMRRLEDIVAALPPPLVLLALAIPFAIAEPLKLFGLLLFARGQFWAGLVVTAFAHLMSFVFVERIYHAGREKLMSYRWFAWIMGQIVRVRDSVLGWVRGTPAYGLAMRTRDAVRNWWRMMQA